MNAAEPGRLRVSVVYLRPDLTFRRTLLLQAPATVSEALAASDVRRQVPELAGAELVVGVFGQRRSLADLLHDGDRIEIYRPLTIDPKEARRLRGTVPRPRRTGEAAKTS
jgi:hypothetical protein